MQTAGLTIGINLGFIVLLKDTWTRGARDRTTNPLTFGNQNKLFCMKNVGVFFKESLFVS